MQGRLIHNVYVMPCLGGDLSLLRYASTKRQSDICQRNLVSKREKLTESIYGRMALGRVLLVKLLRGGVLVPGPIAVVDPPLLCSDLAREAAIAYAKRAHR